jgi:hypothetical protein
MPWIYAHLIGDYLLQNDKMALGKKVSSWWCLAHVLAYMLPFLFCGFSWPQLALIAAQHYAQDRTGSIVWFMKWKGSEGFATGPCAPWSIIVTDNVVHTLWIAAVVEWF